MEMNGEAFVWPAPIYFHPMKYIGGQQEKAVGSGLVLCPFHQIIHISVQEKINLIKVMTVKGIFFRGDFAFGIAVAHLLRSDMCLFVHSVRFSFFS